MHTHTHTAILPSYGYIYTNEYYLGMKKKEILN